MAQLKYKMLHIDPKNDEAWQLLTKAYTDGWRIEWDDFCHKQYHFLLVADSDAS